MGVGQRGRVGRAGGAEGRSVRGVAACTFFSLSSGSLSCSASEPLGTVMQRWPLGAESYPLAWWSRGG